MAIIQLIICFLKFLIASGNAGVRLATPITAIRVMVKIMKSGERTCLPPAYRQAGTENIRMAEKKRFTLLVSPLPAAGSFNRRLSLKRILILLILKANYVANKTKIQHSCNPSEIHGNFFPVN
jgi:hypothetical protein